ncbi:YopX family protein [Enterococcus faecalis]|uniref:YopX family protein n=1 Tax=Enterococcus faecalis TaxID=1351 RepID=UPI001E5C6B79|nr:YopX family protein [Enterococcus faecalis]UFG27272.1 YopX family protein [Enterococcus faecalis]
MIPKFRAWHMPFTDNKFGQEMKYGRAGTLLSFAEMSPNDYILMQSTGLKDLNGVESWEGNYLTKEGCWPFFIKWIENEGCLMAVPVNSIQKTNWKPVSVKELLDKGYVNNSNIYENPELLEGTE